MFNGESKQRVVSSSGKRKEVTRNQVIEDSRKQRELRALEKKRNSAAINIQKIIRRFIIEKQIIKDLQNKIEQQLNTITRINLMIPDFNPPLETILLLMKYSIKSKLRINHIENWIKIINLIIKSFLTNKLEHNLITIVNHKSKISSFQIIFSQFCNEIFLSIYSNASQILSKVFEFCQILTSILDQTNQFNNTIIFRDILLGTLRLLDIQPFQYLQYLIKNTNQIEQNITLEYEELLVTLHKICESILFCNNQPTEDTQQHLKNEKLLGYSKLQNGTEKYNNIISWRYFTIFILSEPNLFSSYWGKKYFSLYVSSSSSSSSTSSLSLSLSLLSSKPSERWNFALTSILSPSLTNNDSYIINYSSIAGNFFQVVLENSEFLKDILPYLWTKLLLFSLNDDKNLLKSIYICYNQEFFIENVDDVDENEDSNISLNITGLEYLEYQIKLCQSKLGNSIIKNNNLPQNLSLNILECLVNSSFLKVSLDLLNTTITSSIISSITTNTIPPIELNIIEAQNNLLVSISKILYCTPPGRLFEDVIPSKSISQTILRVLAFDISSNKIVKTIWSKLSTDYRNTIEFSSNILSENNSHLLVLLNILWHQLLPMDDIEFKEGIKSLSLNEFYNLGLFLKDLLFNLLWIHSISDGKSVEYSSDRLFQIQLLRIGCKVFNHLITRNERLHFSSTDEWTWPTFSPHEFEILPDVEIESGGFPLQNSKLKFVLQTIPQVITFEQRARLFQQFLDFEKQKIRDFDHQPLRIEIHRDHLLQSAFDQLYPLRSELRRDVKVTFINASGAHESGIDGGGLFKEFIDDLMKEMSQTHWGFFRHTPEHRLVPNSVGTDSYDYLQYYSFLGSMLGKAIYEKMLIEPQFAGMFLNHLLGRVNLIDDLPSLDEEVYSNLLRLKRDYLYGNGNLEDLGLTFEINREQSSTSMESTVELIPNGSKVMVIRSNLLAYIYQYANFKLNTESASQSRAFLSGFRDIIPLKWIRMFSAQELQMIIGGDDKQHLDIAALQRHCTYSGGYHPSQPYIQEFWKIIESFSPDIQREFLRFVTSCSRQPLLGFDQLNPPFNIMKIPTYNPGETVSRLPMASACFNQFKLPIYDTIEELREKVLYALQSKSGFELT